jgi:hypothetical protein
MQAPAQRLFRVCPFGCRQSVSQSVNRLTLFILSFALRTGADTTDMDHATQRPFFSVRRQRIRSVPGERSTSV